MKKRDILFLALGVTMSGLFVIFSYTFFGFGLKQSIAVADTTAGPLPQFGLSSNPPLPAELTFAGEKVDLEKWYIRERLERELVVICYSHSLTLMSLKRTTRWFPEIEQVFSEKGIPDDLKYLVLAESNLTNTISPAEAVGFWQILDKTGKQYGLVVNKEVDQRYDPVQATKAAAKYLLHAKELFGTWTLATAAYNAGMRGIGNKLSEQTQSNYFSLHLADETARYVFRAMAFKLVHNFPEKYGFFLSPEHYYLPYKTYEIEVRGTVDNWVDFAKAEGISYAMLKYYNPWIRDSKLKNKERNSFVVKIPVEELR